MLTFVLAEVLLVSHQTLDQTTQGFESLHFHFLAYTFHTKRGKRNQMADSKLHKSELCYESLRRFLTLKNKQRQWLISGNSFCLWWRRAVSWAALVVLVGQKSFSVYCLQGFCLFLWRISTFWIRKLSMNWANILSNATTINLRNAFLQEKNYFSHITLLNFSGWQRNWHNHRSWELHLETTYFGTDNLIWNDRLWISKYIKVKLFQNCVAVISCAVKNYDNISLVSADTKSGKTDLKKSINR